MSGILISLFHELAGWISSWWNYQKGGLANGGTVGPLQVLGQGACWWECRAPAQSRNLVETPTPDVSPAMLLATLTHDMERAFPGPDSPRQDPARGPDDPVYLQAHQERSARIVTDFLQVHQAPRTLVEEVARLIRVHEVGGWLEADWVQAADSLSFLEVNIDPFLKMLDSPQGDWTLETVRAKFAWMYPRIQVPQAREWARSLYEAALEHLHEKEEAMGRLGHQEES